MEYKYEIISDHPLDIPESLRLDDGFADVIGKSLQIALQTGYADESIGLIESIDAEPPNKTGQLNVNDYHIIKVAYPKLTSELEVEGGTTVVLDTNNAKGFRKSIEDGMRLSPTAFADTGGRWLSAREQLRSKMDANHKTADLLGRYYTAVEEEDWVAFRECISDHIQYVGGSWFGNDGDLADSSASSHGYARGIGAYQLLATSKAWRERYTHVRYVLDMSRCMMNQTTAVVSFKILSSENGVDYDNILPIVGTCTSIYQIEDNRIISLQHMVGVDNPVSDTEKISEAFTYTSSSSADQDQTLRLTIGQGVQDQEAGRVYDRYFKALQAQDYDELFEVYDPNVILTSVVDDTGRCPQIQGREAVMANQKTRWTYWLKTHGPLKHTFLTTHINTNTAQMRFQFAETGIEWTSMYTMSNYKITSIRHQKYIHDFQSKVVDSGWAESFHN